MLVAVGLAYAVPLAECERRYDTRELTEAIVSAETGFIDQDPQAFGTARSAMITRLGCLADPLTPATLGRVHQAQALGAFLDQDEPRQLAALAGMLAAAKDHAIPEGLLPEGHKLRARVPEAQALAASSEVAGFRTLPVGWIEVDSVYSEVVQTRRASVLQYIDAQGEVQETRYYWPGDDLGDWKADDGKPKNPPIAAKAPPKPLRKKASRGPQRLAFGVGAGAAAIATGVLYAVAAGAEKQALDLDTPQADAEAARDTANASTWGYIGTSVLTAGLTATLVITW